jgi:hypothetical protein
MPILVLKGRRLILYGVAAVLAFLPAADRIDDPPRDLDGWFTASGPRMNQERVAAFLDAHSSRRPFAAQWWAPVADLEYLSSRVLNFKSYTTLTSGELDRGALVVTNSRFDSREDQRFWSFVSGCGSPVLSAPPYVVYQCGQPVNQVGTPVTPPREDGESAGTLATTLPADLGGLPAAATDQCNIEEINGLAANTPASIRRGDRLEISGWVINPADRSVPGTVYVVLQSVASGTTSYVPVTPSLPRADVSRAKGSAAYGTAGFLVSLSTRDLLPGTYRAFIAFRGSTHVTTCDNGRSVVVG